MFTGPIQSGVALRLPPHSKLRAHGAAMGHALDDQYGYRAEQENVNEAALVEDELLDEPDKRQSNSYYPDHSYSINPADSVSGLSPPLRSGFCLGDANGPAR